MKYSAIILSVILLLSIIPSIVAEEYEEEVLASEEVEVLVEDELEEVLEEDEVEELEDLTEEERRAFFRMTHVTTGRGFVMKEDESDAEFFRGTWIVRKLIETQDSVDAADSAVKSRKFGWVTIGVGDKKQKFRLQRQNSSDEDVVFSLLNRASETVGKMVVEPKRYERLTLWFGSLSLDSGDFSGEWDVTAVTNTRVIKPKIEKISRWNVFKFRERQKVKIKEKVQERLLEKEGLGEIARVSANKDFKEINREQRKVRVDRKERIKEKYKTKTRTKAVDGRDIKVEVEDEFEIEIEVEKETEIEEEDDEDKDTDEDDSEEETETDLVTDAETTTT